VRKSLGTLAAVPGLILLSACGTDSEILAPETEDTQLNLDVARYVADVTADDILLMTGEADPIMQPGFGFAAANCEKRHNKKFRCDWKPFWNGNLSYSREVTFYDSNGEAMDYYDATETESVNFVISMSGTRTTEWMSMAVTRDRDFTVSGLYETETTRTWNGSGKSTRNRTRYSDENGDRTYDMSDTTTVTNVILPVPRRSDWPQAGTIERTVTLEIVAEENKSKTCDVLIEFNGEQYVPITINGVTYTLDLATRKIVEEDE